jgi:predicted CXXCH cytochrome family protein
MTRKKGSRTTVQAPAKTAGTDAATHATPVISHRRQPILIALLAAAVVALLSLWWTSRPSVPATEIHAGTTGPQLTAAARYHYVGRAVCATCHAKEDQMWRGSHHDLAMQEANASTVLGDFAGRKIAYNGIESRFFQRGGRFFVNTDGPDGKLADYAVKYTFGVWPLQQYLIEFPGGRLQALSIAWDARSKAEGGQRWFHLYPHQHIDHKDSLHWTGLYQNWNLQCAACHSTNLKKGYDPASNGYKTRFSELNVSCEACHGPGSGHVDWASRAKAPYRPGDDKGLAVRLHSRWGEAWKFPDAGAKYAQRDRPADPALMNACAACHARRSTLVETGSPGAPLADSHRLALLTQPLYHADGQQRDEVYVWGSFLQSRMFQKGVTCMDCHDAHTSRLRAEGNALCSRCHNASSFDAPQHHFHRPGTAGAQCVGCHMPEENYMVVDARRDHSIRVPRPDLSAKLGSPNACTTCHAGRNPEWAAAAMDKWYGKAWRERPHYGAVLHAGVTQGVKAVPDLLQLARDQATPALVRATAATLLQPHMRPDLLGAARSLLLDGDPEVRIAALGLIEPADPATRVQAAAPLLDDPVRGVRVEAARILADIPDSQFPAAKRSARASALNEYVAALRQDADWPTANVNLGNLHLRQGRAEEAIAAYERALTLDTQLAGAYVNLADAYRMQGRDERGEQVLRRGLARLPHAADVHHALGLLLVRKGDKAAAVAALEQAARRAPDNARYAYVYAVALHSTGRPGTALAVLRDADIRHPNTPDILGTLVSLYREAGDTPAALNYARKLAAAMPDDPEVQRLLAELGGTK